MSNYILKLRTWTTLPGGIKHSGFWLEEYDDNQNLLKASYIDLQPVGSDLFSPIYFDIKLNILPIDAKTQVIDNDYFSLYTIPVGGAALEIFNKIKLEAMIINQYPNKIHYKYLETNCNSAVEYFAEKYIAKYSGDGNKIFDLADSGFFIDGFLNFGGCSEVEDISKVLNKFYEKIKGNSFNLSEAVPNVTDKDNGWYLTISDNTYNYIFDDNSGSSIDNSDSIMDSMIYLGDGHNVVSSGSGNDEIYGGKDVDVVTAGDGNDIIYTYDGDDVIFAGAGSDMIYAGSGNNVIYLGEDNDTDWVCSEGEDGEVDTIYEWEMGDKLFLSPYSNVINSNWRA